MVKAKAKARQGRGKKRPKQTGLFDVSPCWGLSEKRPGEQRNGQHGNQQDARLGSGWCTNSSTQKQPPLGIRPVTDIDIIPSHIGRDDVILELAESAVVHAGEKGLFTETGVADGVVAGDGDGRENVDVVDVLATCVYGSEERGALPNAGHDLLMWWWWVML